MRIPRKPCKSGVSAHHARVTAGAPFGRASGLESSRFWGLMRSSRKAAV